METNATADDRRIFSLLHSAAPTHHGRPILALTTLSGPRVQSLAGAVQTGRSEPRGLELTRGSVYGTVLTVYVNGNIITRPSDCQELFAGMHASSEEIAVANAAGGNP